MVLHVPVRVLRVMEALKRITPKKAEQGVKPGQDPGAGSLMPLLCPQRPRPPPIADTLAGGNGHTWQQVRFVLSILQRRRVSMGAC